MPRRAATAAMVAIATTATPAAMRMTWGRLTLRASQLTAWWPTPEMAAALATCPRTRHCVCWAAALATRCVRAIVRAHRMSAIRPPTHPPTHHTPTCVPVVPSSLLNGGSLSLYVTVIIFAVAATALREFLDQLSNIDNNDDATQ